MSGLFQVVVMVGYVLIGWPVMAVASLFKRKPKE